MLQDGAVTIVRELFCVEMFKLLKCYEYMCFLGFLVGSQIRHGQSVLDTWSHVLLGYAIIHQV